MRDLKLFLAGLGFILFGCALWQVQPELRMLGLAILGLAYLSIAIGAIAEIVTLGRLAAPLAEKILDLRHKSVQIRHQENEMLLRLQVVEYAQTNRLQLEMADMKVTYPPRPMVQISEEKAQQKQLPAPSPLPLVLPPAYDMLSIYKQDIIDPGHIFLGKDGQGQAISSLDDDLCHGAFNSMTGGGKTALERALITQLLHTGRTVILADIKFAPVTENGLDWRPLAKKISQQDQLHIGPSIWFPCLLRKADDIAQLLKWAATTEIDRRMNMRLRGDFSYSTYYIFLEELIAYLSIHPESVDDITRIIVLGRELRLFLFTAAQNFLVKDTKMSGGARENFQTAYFLGGDDHSGALLLDISKKEMTDYLRANNITLGKGIGMLRNNVCMPQAQVVRLGWASNDSVYYLLGRADDWQLLDVGMPGNGESYRESRQQRFDDNPYMHHAMSRQSYAQEARTQVITGNLVKTDMDTPTEPFPIDGESTGNVPPDERLQIVTIAKTHLRIYGKVKRNEIPAQMEKNNRYYPIVKQVLDEEGL